MSVFLRSAEESRIQGITYHLVPRAVWDSQRHSPEYLPEAFPVDGSIHCTNGLDELINVANPYYADDPREFVVLALEVTRISAPVRYDDPHQGFPHIYGPLNTDAVVQQTSVERSGEGTFVTIAG